MLYVALIFMLFLLIFPQNCIQGATTGLLLWFNTIIPTLFPFLFITNVITYKNGFLLFEKLFGKLIMKIFHTSTESSFPILSGLLCGYPMGAKITCDLLKTGAISKTEAQYLLTFVNNPSPVFIANYICVYVLETPQKTLLSLLFMYISIVLTSQITYFFCFRRKRHDYNNFSHLKNTNVQDKTFFNDCIMNACETLVSIGGYMIIFSIFSIIIMNYLPLPKQLLVVIIGLMEQTTGLGLLKELVLPKIKTVLAMCFSCFGGFSIMAQTYSIIHSHGLSLKYYILGKTIFTLIIGILTAFI